jgi:glucosylceramidase
MRTPVLRRVTVWIASWAVIAAAALVGPAGSGWGVHPAAAATGPAISSWVTTPDRSQLLSPGASPVLGSGAPAGAPVVTVDPARTYQTMDGFGASITDSSAALLYRLPAAQRDSVMTSLFSVTGGIGLSFLRQPVGASDFVAGPHYTYDDLPAGQTDLTMARFSIAHDEAQILPLLRRARQLNPQLKVMATPWSPPAWMKTGGSLVGGRLKDDPAVVRAYALYLVRFVQAYQAAGVPIYALTVQNEPQNRTPDAYPGTDLPVAQEAAVIDQLGPMLRDAGLGAVKILSYDHNWAEHPGDIADAQRLGVDPEPNYPYDVLRTSAARWIAGTAYHCYAGDVSAQTALHDAFPAKDIWFTECSGFHGNADSPAKAFSDTLAFHARYLDVGATRNWARTVVNWNLALDPAGKPANGGCGNSTDGVCTGVVTVDGSTVTRNAEFYTLGHLSRFVRPGAVRIDSGAAGEVLTVAFRNPDGSTVLFADNTAGAARTIGISWTGLTAGYTLAAGAIATLTWPAAGGGGGGGGPVDPTRWYQVVNRASGKCLDDTDFGTAAGTPLQQWSCVSPVAANQSWQFRPTADGYYQVVSRYAPGLGWDVSGGSGATADGTGVLLWDYHGGTNQQWRPERLADGSYRFVARHSGSCLDVRDVSTADGARLQQWTCTGGPAQSFQLVG